MMNLSRGKFLFRAVFVLIAIMQSAAAQEVYPSRLVRILVPFPPGGVADTLTRILSEKVSAKLGQPMLIENKAGASGNIGAEMVANARPDGYTLLSTPPPPLVLNKHLFARLPFDPAQFVPITVMASTPNVLVAHPKLRAGNLAELITQTKAHPDSLFYGSTGSGGTPHLTAEWFKAAAGLRITHVSYKGAQSYPAILSGEVDLMFMNLTDALPHLRSGKLKALAVASERRVEALPEVPLLNDTFPGFVSVTWFAIVSTPGTSPAIASKLSAAFAEALRLPEVARKLSELNLESIGSSPLDTASFFLIESERWAKVIRSANIKAE
jgi:tripartite-type tricarboxylate transporter receptor subunit TctC